ncbi:MAG: phosphatidate cytidylyltransferase [Armatimonadota bacterium]|nr:phosphatidate cytidylyltransferase [Armatimonadota bacterium]
MLWQRLLSAAVGIPLALVVVWQGGLWFTGAVLLLALVAYQEFHGALRRKGIEALREVGFPAVAALVLGSHFLSGEELLYLFQGVLVVTAIGSLAFHLFVAVRGPRVVSSAVTVLGVVYIGVLFSFFVMVRELPGVGIGTPLPLGLRLFVVTLLSTWGADTGAYALGKSVGRRKLCPAVSPGKTWEGVGGGILGAVLVAGYAGWWARFPSQHALVLGILFALFGLLGDLSKSVIKRDVGVKDFGTIIPGHGGVLDRLDSLMVNMPAAYLFALAFMQ